ncbi:hypothetical protein F2Q69_00018260 [Brassica cretica]|uniref:Uncharacterized protein n=1 Tax=Brassica cretica TaxID=69181 RepID=A0A8S9PVY8_BRACR|nr:hypothetical protein F2Q69_00018260 [Brassica cretica]
MGLSSSDYHGLERNEWGNVKEKYEETEPKGGGPKAQPLYDTWLGSVCASHASDVIFTVNTKSKVRLRFQKLINTKHMTSNHKKNT